jgi:[ribosomal protein S5]-alanine N-acetyltransferase
MEADFLHMSLPIIQGDGFSIRPYQDGDEVSLQAALNDPRVYERLTNIPRPYTLDDARWWISQSATTVTLATKRINFAIIIAHEVVGSVAFINVDMRQGNAQLSAWIAQRYWGQGLAVRALELLLQFGFQKLRLHRVSAFHVSDNEKSERMLQKLGFTLEGVHKEEWKKPVGDTFKRFDSLHYALLVHEWEKRKEHQNA